MNWRSKNSWTSTVLAIVILCAGIAFGVSGMMGRKSFHGSADNNRNFFTIESKGQLSTTFAFASVLDAAVEISLDSVQNMPNIEFNFDLTKLSTGFPDRDVSVFSSSFLDFGMGGAAKLRVLELYKGRNWVLNNEQRVETNGTATLQIGSITDTVAVELAFRYLQQNEFTLGRLPGDLLQTDGAVTFRLSDFGIKIPEAALLQLDDKIRLRFDIYTSTQ